MREKQKLECEMAEMLEIIEKAREIYANDITDHTENEYIREGLLDAGYRKQEWISVDERLPNPYISVLVYMPDEEPFPTVREGFLTKHGAWYAGGFDRLPDEVVMWKEMPEAPKMKGGAE